MNGISRAPEILKLNFKGGNFYYFLKVNLYNNWRYYHCNTRYKAVKRWYLYFISALYSFSLWANAMSIKCCMTYHA